MTRHFIPLLLLVVFTAGCGDGGRPRDLPELTPCEFTFKYEDGTPLDQAVIMMYPTSGKWYANGSTDSSGLAKMMTQGTYEGAAPGDYKITVTKQNVTNPPGYDPNREDNPDPIVKDLVHRTFLTPDQTPLSINVATEPVKETLKVKNP